jgi:hypothetical protein
MVAAGVLLLARRKRQLQHGKSKALTGLSGSGKWLFKLWKSSGSMQLLKVVYCGPRVPVLYVFVRTGLALQKSPAGCLSSQWLASGSCCLASQ